MVKLTKNKKSQASNKCLTANFMEKQYCGFKSILVCSCDLNPYFEHKKMNPNFNLFTGSAQVHLGEKPESHFELFVGYNKIILALNLKI